MVKKMRPAGSTHETKGLAIPGAPAILQLRPFGESKPSPHKGRALDEDVRDEFRDRVGGIHFHHSLFVVFHRSGRDIELSGNCLRPLAAAEELQYLLLPVGKILRQDGIRGRSGDSLRGEVNRADHVAAGTRDGVTRYGNPHAETGFEELLSLMRSRSQCP